MISPTSERTSSVPLCWRLKNYLRGTISRTEWTTAYGCIVWNGLRTQKTLWRLQRGFLVPRNNAKPAFWKIWVRVCVWLCKDEPPLIKFQNAPPPLQKRLSHQHLWWPRANKFLLSKSSSLISKLKLSLSFALCSFFKRSFDFIVEDLIQQKPSYKNLRFSKLG